MQKLFIVVVVAITLSYIFYVLRKLFSFKYAVIAVSLIALEPFYVALTRVVHLEGLMTTFMLASFVSFFMYLRNSHMRKYLVLSSFFGAAAILTKTSALFLIPFFGLVLLLEHLGKISRGGNYFSVIVPVFKLLSTWIILGIIFFVVLWPAMWTHPQQALRELYTGISDTGVEEGHIQLYFSRLVDDPGITFYPVVLVLRSSVLVLVGSIAALATLKKYDNVTKKFIVYVGLFALFYAIEMSIPSKKLDRYLLPSIVSLCFVAAAAYTKIVEKLEPFVVNYMLLLLLPVYTLLALHPDYLAYYNPLFGGTKAGIFIIEPKWMIGQQAIIDYLEELKAEKGFVSFGDTESIDEYVDQVEINNMLVAGFPVKYYSQIWPFVHEIGGRASIIDVPGHVRNTKYFIYPVWEDTSASKPDLQLTKIAEIKSKGVTLYNVYEKKGGSE